MALMFFSRMIGAWQKDAWKASGVSTSVNSNPS